MLSVGISIHPDCVVIGHRCWTGRCFRTSFMPSVLRQTPTRPHHWRHRGDRISGKCVAAHRKMRRTCKHPKQSNAVSFRSLAGLLPLRLFVMATFAASTTAIIRSPATFQSIARSWLFASRGWPFSRPSLVVTSASRPSVATTRTASNAALCIWCWTCLGSFFVLDFAVCLVKIVYSWGWSPCDTYVFFLPHGDTLRLLLILLSSSSSTLRDGYGILPLVRLPALS